MPNKSLPSFDKKLFAIGAVLIAGGGVAFFTLKEKAKNTGTVFQQEKQSRSAAADLPRKTTDRDISSASVGEAGITGEKNFKTKASQREQESGSNGLSARKEFWRGAKLPDDLIAASLPILEAAEPPASNASTIDRDFSNNVPSAFEDEEAFDYKRANEELYLWLVTEPEAASAWLSGQKDLSKYDMAFGLVADAMGGAGRPDIGEEWAGLIPDSAKRNNALVDMYASMYSRGEPIPEKMRGQVIASDRID